MFRKKIGTIGYECNESTGKARLINGSEVTEFQNAIEAWNCFTNQALFPLEQELRDKLEANGFNRYTGERMQ